ncbi:peptidoglycan-recognition protein SC1a [Dendroctonus ponderosae]|nr:peptidoglycan-recognition protein SC1a [Dendroctonus ponderosae]
MLFVIKHTAGETCTNQKQCSKVVREIQKEHMEVLGFADISYNFLVGGDGKIYNGRGWGVQNEGRNDSLDVAFMGNFNVDDPTTKMMNAALRIQITGQSAGQVKYGKYRVMNHNQTEPTDSPGKRLFAKTISNLNYYSGAVCYHNASGQVVIDYDCP